MLWWGLLVHSRAAGNLATVFEGAAVLRRCCLQRCMLCSALAPLAHPHAVVKRDHPPTMLGHEAGVRLRVAGSCHHRGAVDQGPVYPPLWQRARVMVQHARRARARKRPVISRVAARSVVRPVSLSSGGPSIVRLQCHDGLCRQQRRPEAARWPHTTSVRHVRALIFRSLVQPEPTPMP